jgi:lipopolysaccharide heptosyltransferase I
VSAPVSPQWHQVDAPLLGKVLVVRLSAMGDIIHALPAITSLRAANPDLQIGWLVEQRWSELLGARETDRLAPRSPAKPLVDCVHLANFKAWRKALLSDESWREMKALRHEVRSAKYDCALDLQGAIRSALAAQASGAPMRIGPAEPREKPASLFYTRPISTLGAHVVDHALSIVSQAAGQALSYVPPQFPVDPTAEAWADRTLEQLGSDRLAILNPGAGWGAKCWPAESFGAVARALKELSLTSVVNHGPGEESLAQAVQASSSNNAIPLKCSVGELIALTRRASLFVGGDTGPMHLAAALGVPVVALFGPTRPERNGPYATRSIVLRSPESVDNRSHTNEPDRALTAIQPQAVINAAEALLRGERG